MTAVTVISAVIARIMCLQKLIADEQRKNTQSWTNDADELRLKLQTHKCTLENADLVQKQQSDFVDFEKKIVQLCYEIDDSVAELEMRSILSKSGQKFFIGPTHFLPHRISRTFSKSDLKSFTNKLSEICHSAQPTKQHMFTLPKVLRRKKSVGSSNHPNANEDNDIPGISLAIKEENKSPIPGMVVDMAGKLQIPTALKALLRMKSKRNTGANSSNPDGNEKNIIAGTIPAIKEENNSPVPGTGEDLATLEEKVSTVLRNKEKLPVVCIWGKSGMGKTTFVKKVFHNLKRGGHFKSFAWVSIKLDFQTKKVLQQILQQLLPEDRAGDIMAMDEFNLTREIFKVHDENSYLVVLEDVRTVEDWRSIRVAFPTVEQSNSKILITTPCEEVAKAATSQDGVYKMYPLTEPECSNMLKDKADFTDEELEMFGKTIFLLSGGARLPAIVLGKSLKIMKAEASIPSLTDSGEIQGDRENVLGLSYVLLPHELKPCLLYMGQFPEGRDIEIEKLYCLLSAENLIIPPKDSASTSASAAAEAKPDSASATASPFASDVAEAEPASASVTSFASAAAGAKPDSASAIASPSALASASDVAETEPASASVTASALSAAKAESSSASASASAAAGAEPGSASATVSPSAAVEAESTASGGRKATLEKILNMLGHRSMVQVQDMSSKRNFKSCRLHDQIRDFCLIQGLNEDFFEIVEFKSAAENFKGIPRLAVYLNKFGDENTTQFIIGDDMAKKLRSLLIFDTYQSGQKSTWPSAIHDLKEFIRLRVVDFNGIDFRIRKLPKGIDKLVLLKYLSFQGCWLEDLPSYVSKLICLETLDLRTNSKITIPDVLHTMTRLRHLYFPSEYEIQDRKSMLQLNGLEKLEILVNLDTSMCKVQDLPVLKNLLILTTLTRGNYKNLNSVIECLEENKAHLQYSSVTIKNFDCYTKERRTIFNNLLQCDMLHRLNVEGQIDKLSKDVSISPSITEMIFDGSELSPPKPQDDHPMEVLGKHEKLRSLVLSNDAFIGPKISFSAGPKFPNLEILKLQNLSKVEEVIFEDYAMPKLSTLVIQNCRALKKLTISENLESRLLAQKGDSDFSVQPTLPNNQEN